MRRCTRVSLSHRDKQLNSNYCKQHCSHLGKHFMLSMKTSNITFLPAVVHSGDSLYLCCQKVPKNGIFIRYSWSHLLTTELLNRAHSKDVRAIQTSTAELRVRSIPLLITPKCMAKRCRPAADEIPMGLFFPQLVCITGNQ